jgi:hypothetical protein
MLRATVLLSDRVIVDRVAIAHGRVAGTYLTCGFDEALASLPTIPVTRYFALGRERAAAPPSCRLGPPPVPRVAAPRAGAHLRTRCRASAGARDTPHVLVRLR